MIAYGACPWCGGCTCNHGSPAITTVTVVISDSRSTATGWGQSTNDYIASYHDVRSFLDAPLPAITWFNWLLRDPMWIVATPRTRRPITKLVRSLDPFPEPHLVDPARLYRPLRCRPQRARAPPGIRHTDEIFIWIGLRERHFMSESCKEGGRPSWKRRRPQTASFTKPP